MIRRRFLAAAAALALAACGGDKDPVSPDVAVVGSYSLRTINGSPLPFSLGAQGGSAVSVTGGALTMNADRTYSQTLTLSSVGANGTTTQTIPDHGTYTVSGTSTTFLSATDGSSVTAAYANGTITVSEAGVVLVYQR